MASFLYLGAGIGLFLFGIVEKLIGKGGKKEPLTKKELPYTIAMVRFRHCCTIFWSCL